MSKRAKKTSLGEHFGCVAGRPLDISDSPQAAVSWVERYHRAQLSPAPDRPRAVLGIDASLTGFAYAVALAPVLRDSMHQPADLELQHDSPPATTARGRVDRYRQMVWPLVELTTKYDFELVLIEGYATGFGRSKGFTQVWLHELGGILRHELVDRTRCVLECAPAMLKRWATGKGAGKKIAVATALAVENQRMFTDDNQADAFALMQIAAATMGYSPGRLAHHRSVASAMQDIMRAAGYIPPPIAAPDPAVQKPKKARKPKSAEVAA